MESLASGRRLSATRCADCARRTAGTIWFLSERELNSIHSSAVVPLRWRNGGFVERNKTRVQKNVNHSSYTGLLHSHLTGFCFNLQDGSQFSHTHTHTKTKFLCGLRARKYHLDFVPHQKTNKNGSCVTKFKFICAFACIQYCE